MVIIINELVSWFTGKLKSISVGMEGVDSSNSMTMDGCLLMFLGELKRLPFIVWEVKSKSVVLNLMFKRRFQMQVPYLLKCPLFGKGREVVAQLRGKNAGFIY